MSNTCELVCNGGFETGPPANSNFYGVYPDNGLSYCGLWADNWCNQKSTPDIMVDNQTVDQYVKLNPTLPYYICAGGQEVNIYNGPNNPNNLRMLRLYSGDGLGEAIKAKLKQPLIPGHTYKVQFYAYQCVPCSVKVNFSFNNPPLQAY